MKFPILKSTNGQWFFRIVASNSNVLAHSETYWNKADARSAAQTIINQAGSGQIVE
ncbi:YegP family protein [Lentzea sp. NPDC004782]|uniref:YegP family protein n=1 Tax=Lentzea sp. NPDC004782 TaxID=3154458 RepID=UPI0033B89712